MRPNSRSKRFKGNIAEGSTNSSTSVKLEPAYLAEHEEAAGYTKQQRGEQSVEEAYSLGNQRS